MSVTTDYTKQTNTFQSGFAQQYRLVKYLRDFIQNWLADSDNVKDPRLARYLYDVDGNLRQGVVRVCNPFTTNGKFAGSTPLICVYLQNIVYDKRPGVIPGFAASQGLQKATKKNNIRKKIFTPVISVITEQYDASLALTQLIQMYILLNAATIQHDCSMLSQFDIQSIDAPTVVETQTQSKQVYGSVIKMSAVGYIAWQTDTQGPVFKGIELNKNF